MWRRYCQSRAEWATVVAAELGRCIPFSPVVRYPCGGFVMSGGEHMTTDTGTAPLVLHAIDDMLRICGMVRAEKPRDPMRRLEDVLLEMRHEVSE